ncbi:DUF3265 domain-containing protein [Vibrio parahaemolyticus]|nr:DUF3265 domain-containing protein [Vibrio parahaemolyticus]
MSNTHNKAFKRDSCRVAFWACGEFGGESGLRKVGLCGIHPLTQRYVLGRSNEYRRNGNFRFRLSR